MHGKASLHVREYELVMEKNDETLLYIDFENGEELQGTGKELYQIIFESDQPWVLSSNGTILDQSKKGIIPACWNVGMLNVKYYKRICVKSSKGNVEETAYWDKRQLVKKINLNSLYGALLNQVVDPNEKHGTINNTNRKNYCKTHGSKGK